MFDVKKINASAISTVSELAPWLGTFPTAWTVGEASITVLGWQPWVGYITGAAVELLGLAASDTALRLYSYHVSKRKSDPEATVQMYVAGGTVVVYFATAIVLTAVLKQNAILALFPLLSLVGTVNLALRSDHEARLSGIEVTKAEEKEERKLHRLANAKPVKVAKVDSIVTNDSDNGSVSDKMGGRKYALYVAESVKRNGQGPLTPEQAAESLGVSVRTAYRYQERYQKEHGQTVQVAEKMEA